MTDGAGPKSAAHPDMIFKVFPPEDHEIYMIIGQVASVWSLIENDLDRLIWSLLRTHPELGACVTSQLLGSGPRMTAIAALMIARGFSKKQIDAAHDLKDAVSDPNEQRNRLIHDATMISASGKVKTVRGADRKSVQKRKNTPYALRTGILDGGGIEAARGVLASVGKAYRKVSAFRKMVLAGPDTSPRK